MRIALRRGAAPALIISLTSAFSIGSAARAQAPPVLTLDEAQRYARDHQPQIRSALAEWSARKSEARIPRAQWLPQVGATAQLLVGATNNTTASYLSVPEVDLPRIGATKSATSTDWSPSPSTLAALTIDQEVYDFGRIAAQISVADALAETSHANADIIALDVQLAVEEAFHGVLASKEVLSATEDAYKRAVTHRDYAQAGVKSGMRPPIDLTRAQADVAQLDVRRIRAQAGVTAARAALAAAVGSTAPEIDAQPLSPDELPAPAFTEVLRLAAERNPLVAAALARVRAQEFQTHAIARELAPNLIASAGLSGRAGGAAPSTGNTPFGAGWLPDVGNWHLGLVLQWNIFDGTVLARRSASRAREEAARADLELARMSIALGAERAWLELDATLRALPSLRESVDAARANQAQADARFKAGLGNIVELADAETLFTRAQLELAIGVFGVARARAALGRVMGQSVFPSSGIGKVR